uniref:3'-5' exonuclease domain-containing protein n=1 Tax=Globodera pallida TaxID=36090 RepID=A0A183CDK8_GLOPA
MADSSSHTQVAQTQIARLKRTVPYDVPKAKWEKLEHKHAKRTARREQRLQDHTSRVMNRLERLAKARTMGRGWERGSKSGQRGFVWQIDSEFVQSFADATAGHARQLQIPLFAVQHALKFQMDYEAHNREVLSVCAIFDSNRLLGGHQMQLSRYRLCTVPQLLGFVQHVDLCFYQLLLDQLLPDPLCPSLPAHAHGTAHRNQLLLPQTLGDGAPSALRELKFAGVRLLSNAFTRLSSVAHLAITAREVLHSDEQMSQMHADFDRLDFSVLHEQAEWCCDWSLGWLRSLEQQFGARLAQRRRLEDWADWLDDLAARALQRNSPAASGCFSRGPSRDLVDFCSLLKICRAKKAKDMLIESGPVEQQRRSMRSKKTTTMQTMELAWIQTCSMN